MAHIVLLTLGSGGDLYPFLRAGVAALEDGHKVTLVTHCVYDKVAQSYGFDFVAFDTMSEYQLMMNADIQMKIHDPKAVSDYFIKYLLPRMEASFHRILEVCSDDTIIIGHYMLHGLNQAIVEKLGFPYIAMFYAPSFFEVNTAQHVMEHIAHEFNYFRFSVGLSPIKNWGEMMKYYNCGIACYPKWFGEAIDNSTRITNIGFLLHENKEDIPEDLKNWFVENNPVLITHATTPPVSNNFFTACVEACGELNYPAIAVAKNREYIPKNLPSNVKYTNFLPFSKVMPFVRVLAHHGGVGTLAQALRSGVPQLILGNGFDRPLNASYVKKLGAGNFVPMPNWNKSDVIEPLKQLIYQSEIRERCRTIATQFEWMDVNENMKEVIKQVIASPGKPDAAPMYHPVEEASSSKKNELLKLLKNIPAHERSSLLTRIRD
jgi:UDP:flavonoid glycosyltransferase YjiC (YdhE family)